MRTKANEGGQQCTLPLQSQKGWLGGNTEVPHTSAAIRSGQLLFMTLHSEACVLFRAIHARQRMGTKPNPGLEAVHLHCSNSVAVLLLAPALCCPHNTVLRSLWRVFQVFPSILCWQYGLQHVEDEKSRQEKRTASQVLLKKKGWQGSRTRKELQLLKPKQEVQVVTEDEHSEPNREYKILGWGC